MVELSANSGDLDQNMGLHCLQNTLLGVSRLQWVKNLYEHIYLRDTA